MKNKEANNIAQETFDALRDKGVLLVDMPKIAGQFYKICKISNTKYSKESAEVKNE
jgi:hypothetical protein